MDHQFIKNRSTSFDFSYRSQRAKKKISIKIKDLKVERFKKLSSRSNSPNDPNLLKSKLPFLRNKMGANIIQQIKKFRSTENEWKQLKQNVLKCDKDVKNLTQKCYVSYQPNENSSALMNKGLTQYDFNKLTRAIKDAKSCLATLKLSQSPNTYPSEQREEDIYLDLSDSSENIKSGSEELSPCKESSIARPNESIKPLGFFNKREKLNKKAHKENLSIQNKIFYNSILST